MELVDQALFERGGACKRNLGEKSRVEAQRDDDDAGKDCCTQARLIHSPAPSERFIAAKTRPPITRASASEVAAPAA